MERSSSENNICFVANFNKTYLFDAIASRLRRQGCNIYWITVNRKLYEFLKGRYQENNILLINKDDIKTANDYIDDFKLYELVYGDRVLRLMPAAGISFLTGIQRPLYDFISTNHIKFIFGELTWAHEILIHRMVSRRKGIELPLSQSRHCPNSQRTIRLF